MNKSPPDLTRKVLTDPVHFLAFGFGFGLAPVAPGTFGSIPGLLIFWLTLDFGLYVQLGIAAAMAAAGIWICGESARRIGVHDHGGIVWDETVAGWVAAFLLFRFMDIVKPWPIRDLDHRLRGGAGIMLDDLVAALYAAILLAFWGWLVN